MLARKKKSGTSYNATFFPLLKMYSFSSKDQLPCDPVILVLSMHLREMFHTKTFIWIHSNTIHNCQNILKYLWIVKWTNNVRYIYTKSFYWQWKKYWWNTVWANLENIVSERSNPPRIMHCIILFICFVPKSTGIEELVVS